MFEQSQTKLKINQGKRVTFKSKVINSEIVNKMKKIEKIEEKLIEKYVGKKRSTTSTQLKQNVTFAIVFKLTFNLWREL